MNITINGTLEPKELATYIKQIKDKHPNEIITEVTLTVSEEFVDLSYKFKSIPFERIRRITGYLVGNTDKWNNAKSSELKDRVKHNVEDK
jgi:hypothetical protein